MAVELVKKKSKSKSEYAPKLPLEEALEERAKEVGTITGPHWHVTRTAFPHEGNVGKDVIKNFKTEDEARRYCGQWPTMVQTVWKIPVLDDVHFMDMVKKMDRVVIDKKYKAKMRKCTKDDCPLGSWQPD